MQCPFNILLLSYWLFLPNWTEEQTKRPLPLMGKGLARHMYANKADGEISMK